MDGPCCYFDLYLSVSASCVAQFPVPYYAAAKSKIHLGATKIQFKDMHVILVSISWANVKKHFPEQFIFESHRFTIF
jgi:hypothetical protein